jgi:hypothetical protein
MAGFGRLVTAGAVVGASALLAVPAGGLPAPAVTPNVGTCNQLTGVAARSASDVWAVGTSCVRTGGERTLVLHSNGRTWSVVKSPNVGPYRSSLAKVVALSPTSAWAVGSYAVDSKGTSRTLALHWNGTSWRVVPAPSRTGGSSVLTDVSAVSGTDVWAVGYWGNGLTGGALALHWNGAAWKLVPTPPGASFALYGVSARSASDVWGTGTRRSAVGTVATLSMHWNGRAWGLIPMPNAGAGKNNFLLGGVRVVGPRDVWAVGSYNAGTEVAPVFRTLAVHHDGSRWSLVPTPNRSSSHLYGGVAGTSATDVWAVGRGGRGALVEHWNGRAWSLVTAPSPGTRNNELLGVAAVSPSSAFAVGVRSNVVNTALTLVLRWNGRTWTAL